MKRSQMPGASPGPPGPPDPPSVRGNPLPRRPRTTGQEKCGRPGGAWPALCCAPRERDRLKHAVLRPASRRWRLVSGAALAVLALSLAGLAGAGEASATGRAASSALTALSPEFNRPGNILIADQFNNRVIEVDRDRPHRLAVRQRVPTTSARHSIVGANDAERVGPFTLMAGTGDPPVRPGRRRPATCAPTWPTAAPTTGSSWSTRPATSSGSTASSASAGSGPDQLNTPGPGDLAARRPRADHRPGQRADHRGHAQQADRVAVRDDRRDAASAPTSSTTPTAPSCWPTATS